MVGLIIIIILILLAPILLFLLIMQFLAKIGLFEITHGEECKEEMDNSEYDYGHNVRYNDVEDFLN